MLLNGSFTEGWEDLPPAGKLVNQRPTGWTLRWVEPGESLFGAPDVAGEAPECVHKLAAQLPEKEREGGSDALILEGGVTYKIFHAKAAFGAELSQAVADLVPGTEMVLTVPILCGRHKDDDPWGAETGVWVNGAGDWVNAGAMGDRKWYSHTVRFTVPADGRALIAVRFKSKWALPKDFFIDRVTLEPAAAPAAKGANGATAEAALAGAEQILSAPIRIEVPPGIRLVTAEGDDPETIVVIVPHGTPVVRG